MTPQQEIEAQREFLRHDKQPSRSDHLRALRRRLAWVSAQCDLPRRDSAFSFLIAERRALEYAVGILEQQQKEEALRRQQHVEPGPPLTT